ncbi:MAG: DUF4261 domain-containing protein [Pirellulales bacterium]|nr:DUF4261 domain-containing protein [Pirellulales bacterium]
MSNPLRWLTLVPLSRLELPTAETIAATYRTQFAGSPEPNLGQGTERLLTATIGEHTVAAGLIDRPIPWSQLEGPASAAWYWPTAADELRDHPAHLLVTLVDEGGSAMESALTLTRWTATLAAAAPACGVLWGPGRLVHRPADFVEQAGPSTLANLPLFLWIDFRIEPAHTSVVEGASVLRLYTTGLAALGQSEIEVPLFKGEPQQLLRHAYNAAHYLLDRKQVVSDGDTIALAEGVQATVRRIGSMLGGDLEVVRLEWNA